MTPTTMSRIATATAHAVLPAEDLSRAKHFYHDDLGLEITEMPGQFLAHAGSGTTFLVYERAHTVAEHTAAVFMTDDLRATVDDLRSHGVRFEEYDLPGLKTVDGIAESPTGWSAWFTDTEGNIISVAQMK